MKDRKKNPVLSFFLRRKWLSVFFLLILSVFLFKGSIYRACVTYKITGTRINTIASETKNVNSVVQNKKTLTRSEMIEWSLDTCSALLSFTSAKCKTNGLLLLQEGGSTNCIGYSRLCALLCQLNFESQQSSLNSKTCIAEMYFLGYNIHQLFDSPFWKDHDIVLITGSETGERILLDPTLYDYTGIGIVSERK